ncbi:hypothetical protein EG327_007471 [Venturia inaequalis]|uniref:Peptidase M3A/M3B catalytic domain-containing protein n=1 Tax=Venturia inaequalis TaxID=5025 RepID=A0A8H3Z2F8_VENIN|nr:hypothetical protein EG327_007471 [Venturia inaequalis]
MARTPPQPPPSFTREPSTIEEDVERLIRQLRLVQDQVSKVQPGIATFESVLTPLANAENAMNLEKHRIIFYQNACPDVKMRDASSKAQVVLDNFTLEAAMREDLFSTIDALYHGNLDVEVDRESLYYLKKCRQEFLQHGLSLADGPDRLRFRDIKSRLSQLSGLYSKNLASSNEGTGVWFSLEELSGLPEMVLSQFEQRKEENETKFKVPLSNFFPTLEFATNSATRRQLLTANENKCVQNLPILKEVLMLRDEAARLLGHPNHATSRLGDMMAGSPDVVNHFLEDLRERLTPAGTKELEDLKLLKKLDGHSQADDGSYFLWDHPYYARRMLESDYSVDHQMISQYFPLQNVIHGLLNTFQTLFGLLFEEIVTPHPSMLWHEDVQLFSVWDDEELGSGFVGYLYLDMFSRDGKRGNASCYNLVPGFTREDGSRQYPSTALLCSFTRPASLSSTSLVLQHSDVVTLIHELGHGIHDLVSKTKFSRFHGPDGTVVDFGEAPSQMLESWCWEPTFLKKLSRHYSYVSSESLLDWNNKNDTEGASQPPEQIPDELIDRLVRTKYVNSALFYLRQVALGTFDMEIHQPPSQDACKSLDIAVRYSELRRSIEQYGGLEGKGKWGQGVANWGHIMGEYHAGYYSYLFSKVYAADMYFSNFMRDPMNPREGRRYRRMVLEKGGSQHEMETSMQYLGHPPKTSAFYKELGLT